MKPSMKSGIVASGLAAALALPIALAPASASASCADDKTTGTILGGVGGALIGNSIARGGGGMVLGGVGGALLGRHIAGSNCRHARYAYAGPPRGYAPPPTGPGPGPGPEAGPMVYYNQYGDPISPAAGPPGAPPAASGAAYADAACRTETRSFYDDRGVLVRQPVRVCGR